MYNIVLSIAADTKDQSSKECVGIMVCSKSGVSSAPTRIFKSDDVEDLERQVKEAVDEFFKTLKGNKKGNKK